jgi:hypothetical protein
LRATAFPPQTRHARRVQLQRSHTVNHEETFI